MAIFARLTEEQFNGLTETTPFIDRTVNETDVKVSNPVAPEDPDSQFVWLDHSSPSGWATTALQRANNLMYWAKVCNSYDTVDGKYVMTTDRISLNIKKGRVKAVKA